ncbi:MAG: DMT family transporter [Ruminococcaceae bacterium]|nr:DMT family transporter [Oscillospiraceae bacterium]
MNELMNYGLLTTSTVMFGFMFFFKDIFRKNYGSGPRAAFVANLGGGIFGFIALILINGFSFEFSLFAFIMAIISTINGLLFSFCSLKALSKINLSLYSLFSMLGGMALPFLSGILFHGESVTVSKCVCFAIITVAICLTVKKDGSSGGALYYVGVFVFNGMAGVISKIYYALPFERISATGYSVLTALVSISVSFLLVLFVKGEKKRINAAAVFAMAGSGTLSRLGNWLLLVALAELPASAQYPFVTGGTIIVSTAISLFGKNKPTKKELIAVALAFIGVLTLVLLPSEEIFKIIWK